MPHAILLNGAQNDPLAAAVLQDTLHNRGFSVQQRRLWEAKIAPCLGCFDCWVKTPGRCRNQRDDADRLCREMLEADVMILLTPVTFGGYNALVKGALDRSLGLLSPMFQSVRSGPFRGEVHHRARYPRYPSMLGVGLLADPSPQEEGIFRRLVARNAVNLHSPRQAAGFLYPAQQNAAQMRTCLFDALDAITPIAEA